MAWTGHRIRGPKNTQRQKRRRMCLVVPLQKFQTIGHFYWNKFVLRFYLERPLGSSTKSEQFMIVLDLRRPEPTENIQQSN